MKQRVKVIGITGGIASGKSTVAKMLRSLGASVINADKICHQLINTEEIKGKISKKWGNNIQDKDGKINRRALGKIVFADKGKLLVLNKIIHPKVIKRIKSQIAELTVKDTTFNRIEIIFSTFSSCDKPRAALILDKRKLYPKST